MESLSGFSTFYFIDGDNSRHSDSMMSAFKLLSKEGFPVSWKDERQLNQLDLTLESNNRESCYVIESFNGRVFNFLKSRELSIIGPNCIIHSIQYNETLVRRNYPVKSFCMRGVLVTLSELNKSLKDELSQKVTMMGGRVCNEITSKTTHIVANSVMTRKCQNVRAKLLPIMKPSWITDSFEKCHTHIFKATSRDLLKKYKLPIFQGATICVSQLNGEKRNEVKKIVSDHCGVYTPALNLMTTTHLILENSAGEKYNAAKSTNKIFIVSLNWLLDSVAKGQILSEEQYAIDSCSSLNRSNRSDVLIERKSSSGNQIETRSPRISNTEVVLSNINELSQLVRHGSDLFDGFYILLIGCDTNLYRKLSRMIVVNHGFVYNTPKDLITHVIIGPNLKKTEIDDYRQKLPDLTHKFLSFEWIADCIRKNKILDFNDYHVSQVQNSAVNDNKNGQNPGISTNQLSTAVEKKKSVTFLKICQNDNDLFSEYEGSSLQKNCPENENILPDMSKPLLGCVITFSAIDSSEKEKLVEMAKELGAICQGFFSRRDVPERDIKANTHLIVSNPTKSDKFKKSLEWNIPCISKEWLYKCTESKLKEKEDEFIFRNDTAENDNLLMRLEGYKADIAAGETEKRNHVYKSIGQTNHFGDLVRQQINDEFQAPEVSDLTDEIPVTWRKRDL